MATYRLEKWRSQDLTEVVDLVLQLLGSLPSPCAAGCFNAYFHDWGLAPALSALPSTARISAAFTGDGVPLDALRVTAQSSLGDVRVNGGNIQTGLYRFIDTPFYGHRGELEPDVVLSIEEILDSEGTHRRPHDAALLGVLEDVAQTIGLSIREDSIRKSTVHGFPRGKNQFSYMLRVPLTLGEDAILKLSRRVVPSPDRINWEVIGSFHTVNSAILSLPDGAKIGWDQSPWCTGARKTYPPFAIERAAPFRPIANVALDRVMDLARGLIPLHDRLILPSLYFGPLIWPSTSIAPEPILWNYVRITRHRQEWGTDIGIWQESDGDPTVKDVRRHLVPILKAIRPTSFSKAGSGISSD